MCLTQNVHRTVKSGICSGKTAKKENLKKIYGLLLEFSSKCAILYLVNGK